MRSLALARYHVLSKVRSSYGVFATALILTALPVLTVGFLFVSWTDSWGGIEVLLSGRAMTVHIVYVSHLIVLLITCDLFGTPRAIRGGNRPADLTETVPLTPAQRFFGDAAGIFQSAAAVHLCTLPLLALAIALSPLPIARFFWLEALVLAVLVLASAGGSWKLRSTGKWMRTRSARSAALFVILFLIIVISTTRWEAFRDAALTFLFQASPWAWNEARAAVISVPMLIGLLALLYIGYIAYYTLSSIRSMERGQEKVHAL